MSPKVMKALLPLAVIASAAAQIPQCRTVAPDTATLFSYENMGSYQKVTSVQCGESYILYQRGQAKPDLGADYKYFAVPLQKVAVTQTVTNTFLEAIGVREKMAIASPYTSASCIAKMVADGDAEAFISSSDNVTEHARQMGDSSIDAIFSDPWYTSKWEHPGSFSKVICEASTYETSPLGSAEWIKFFGYLFGKEAEAEAAYCGTLARYSCNSISASRGNVGSYKVPKVVFASFSSWTSSFAIHMPPYKSQFVHDAGAVYPDLSPFEANKKMHWTGTQVSSFDFPAENISLFHDALGLADVIIDENWPHGNDLKAITKLYKLPIRRIGQTFLAGVEQQDGALGNAGWSLVSAGVAEKLFTYNDREQIVPALAKRAVRADDDTWTITLQPGRMFSDGAPVTAAVVAAALTRTNEINSRYAQTLGKMTVTAVDELTLSISTEITTPIMESVLCEFAFVIYKQNPDGNFVYTGPYAITGHEVNHMDLEPNTHYPWGTKQRIPIQIKKYTSGAEVSAAIQRGEIDIAFNLPSTEIAPLNWHNGLTVTSFNVGQMYMAFFNSARWPDVRVREAFSLIINRRELALRIAPPGLPASDIDMMVSTSAFPRGTTWGKMHTAAIQTDTARAASLLDAAGWVLIDGVRTKGETQLSLDLVYYTFRADLVAFVPLIKAQFEALGIKITTRVNDDGLFHEQGGYDILLWAQHTLQAGDPNFFLETFFKSTNVGADGAWAGQNFGQLASTNIDNKLAALQSAEGATRAMASKDAMQAILDEYPATFLVNPMYHVAVNTRMDQYTPWGTDYYVVKPHMPPSDWPKAIVDDRVFTLDGTMDSRGPPYGGTDWYESRVAEPDGMLADLIAVLHPSSSGYVPEGLHYLRHASTGATKIITPEQCVDVSAPRPIKAPTCSLLDVPNPTAGGGADGKYRDTAIDAVQSKLDAEKASKTELENELNELQAKLDAEAAKKAAVDREIGAAQAKLDAELARKVELEEMNGALEKEIANLKTTTVAGPTTTTTTNAGGVLAADSDSGSAAASADDDDTGLYVAIGVISGVLVLIVLGLVVAAVAKSRKAQPAGSDDVVENVFSM